MTEPARNDLNQFESAYSDLELYEVVREVAKLTVKPGRDPARIPQRRWDEAMAASQWSDAPKAKNICDRLRDESGCAFTWRRLLAEVFSGKSLERVDTSHRSALIDALVDSERIFYALRRAHAVIGRATLLPDDYVTGRKELIRRDKARWKHGGQMEELLPTLNQIYAATDGDWDLALDWAELPARSWQTVEQLPLVPRAEVIARFVAETGEWPTALEITPYAKDKDFLPEARKVGRGHAAYITESKPLLAARGVAEPLPRKRGSKASWSKASGRLEGEAAALVEATETRRVQALQEFLSVYKRHAAGGAPTKALYRQLRRDETLGFRHWPGLSSFDGRSWPIELETAEKPGALERAEATDLAMLAARGATVVVDAAVLHRRNRGSSIDSPYSQRILELLRERGPTSSEDLRGELAVSKSTLRRSLKGLIEAGLVVVRGKTHQARYLLAP